MGLIRVSSSLNGSSATLFRHRDPPFLPADDKSHARLVSRYRIDELGYQSGSTEWEEPQYGGEIVPIELVHGPLSCVCLPLYLPNVFTDRDHLGIGVLTDAGVPRSPRGRCVIRFPQDSPLPNRPIPTHTIYLGMGLGNRMVSMVLMVRVPFHHFWRHWCFTKAQITHSTASSSTTLSSRLVF